ncbi:ArnT family glycosyltransferase [Candidatus Viridilinea mediisalina]|uniref:Glycosyltransferase RgtA/B/C/D-like domain-containing protein n=1 Tax=Candidatus Viridilinea mediisalina TaxID=2024553 RepID=A0A2A6RP16_9CHLR|nr:glycosyltransferase family 39 protein [Candidatus Viridilinea mediisalina]PDW04844.1 hypothetical protein CJ255_01145 [Candidatus Viridilinea mediisalina]
MQALISHALALIMLTLLTLVGGALLAQPSLELQAEHPRIGQFLARFYALETHEQATYRWSAGEAAIFLHGFEGQPALVRLRLAGPRAPGDPSALVELSTAGVPLAHLQTSEHWRDFWLMVPTQPSGETALVLRSAPFRAPGDPRELGVALSNFSASAVPMGNALPQPIRTIYLAAMPLLLWLLLIRLGANPRLALGGGSILAGLVGLAVALPSSAGYWLPTLGWPWFPLLPLMLLLAWPALKVAHQRVWAWLKAHPWTTWLGVGLALAALLLLRFGLPAPLGVSLLILGVWAGLPHIPRQQLNALASQPSQALRTPHFALGLMLIFSIALGLRLVNLDAQPAGLWRDEARHGLQALQIWHDPTYRPIYVVGGADLPALLFYLMAPIVGFFGPELWSARLISALAGALTPLALAWAATPLLGRRNALIAAALLAWASWSLSMSRWAFPATLDHLFTLTAIGLLWRGMGGRTEEQRSRRAEEQKSSRTEEQKNKGTKEQKNRGTAMSDSSSVLLFFRSSVLPFFRSSVLPFFRSSVLPFFRSSVLLFFRSSVPLFLCSAAAGCLGALALYTYHTGRVAPLVLAAVVLLRLGVARAAWQRALPGLAVALLVGLITVSPLAFYLLNDLAGYNRRVGSVSLLDSQSIEQRTPAALLLANLRDYALAYHVAGDSNGRHHLPNAPLLDPLVGLGLAFGLGLSLAGGWRQPALALPLALGGIYMLPGIFSGDAPHAMRSLGTLAPACMLAAVGFTQLSTNLIPMSLEHAAVSRTLTPIGTQCSAIGNRQSTIVNGIRAKGLLMLFILGASLSFNVWLYFGIMRYEPRVYHEFDLVTTSMGHAARAPWRSNDAMLRQVRVYLPQSARLSEPVRYLGWGLPAPGIYGDGPIANDGPALIILPASANLDEQARAITALGPDARALGPTAYYPGSNTPITLAFGRGAAAERLVESLARK